MLLGDAGLETKVETRIRPEPPKCVVNGGPEIDRHFAAIRLVKMARPARMLLGACGSPSRSNLHRNEVDLGVKAAGNAARSRPPLACRQSLCYILNHMVQSFRSRFDASFAALSDATRRGVLEQLGRANASITDLAEKFHMTLTGMKKHVGVLERAGLVSTEKVGRVRTCKLGPRRLEEEAAWIERYRQLWDARFDELDKIVEELKRKEKVDGRKKR